MDSPSTRKHASLPETLLALKQLTWVKDGLRWPWLHELDRPATQVAPLRWRERLWQITHWTMIGAAVLVLYVFIVLLPSL